MRYFDSGVLLKLYLPEPNSARAVALTQEIGEAPTVTPLHELEMRSAARQKVGRRETSDSLSFARSINAKHQWLGLLDWLWSPDGRLAHLGGEGWKYEELQCCGSEAMCASVAGLPPFTRMICESSEDDSDNTPSRSWGTIPTCQLRSVADTLKTCSTGFVGTVNEVTHDARCGEWMLVRYGMLSGVVSGMVNVMGRGKRVVGSRVSD